MVPRTARSAAVAGARPGIFRACNHGRHRVAGLTAGRRLVRRGPGPGQDRQQQGRTAVDLCRAQPGNLVRRRRHPEKEPRQYDVVALRDTKLVCIPSAVFEILLQQSTRFNRFVIDELNRKLRPGHVHHPGRPQWQRPAALGLGTEPHVQEPDPNPGAVTGRTSQSGRHGTSDRQSGLLQLGRRGVVRLAMHRITVLDEQALLQCVSEGAATDT